MMNENVIMKCGHSPNATDGDGKPCCVICAPKPDAYKVVEAPSLEGRKARCSYYGKTFNYRGRQVTCHGEADSKTSLPFFEHKPGHKYDSYYCGCWGWD